MVTAAMTQLIPLAEMTPGQVGHIRNAVINKLVSMVSTELNLPPEKLVVRDVRPVGDLAIYASAAVASTIERWRYNATQITNGFNTVATGTMADQRWIALFGLRDLRFVTGSESMTASFAPEVFNTNVSLVKLNVGGADKVIWDTTSMEAYPENPVAFTPSPVVIPQNTIYTISYYNAWMDSATDCGPTFLQLIGITVEPRGKLVSP